MKAVELKSMLIDINISGWIFRIILADFYIELKPGSVFRVSNFINDQTKFLQVNYQFLSMKIANLTCIRKTP